LELETEDSRKAFASNDMIMTFEREREKKES